MTRTGPGKNYPGVWLYQRRDLPVRVVKKYENWRLIQDPDGAQGWMLVTLLSDRRTAIVKPGEPRPIRVGPYDSAKVALPSRAGRRRPHQQVQRRLVPDRDRQARGLYPHVRHLGRRATAKWSTERTKGETDGTHCRNPTGSPV